MSRRFLFWEWKLAWAVYTKPSEEEPLERQKEAINELLGETGKRFVIVIDDIDRLDSQETKLVFKLVRMTANFANTVFLLAYDRGNVGKRITENGIEGEGFLKKIVQLPFPLPRVDQRDLFQILFREIRETIKSFDGKSWGWESWEDFFDPDLDEDNFHPNDLRRRWEDLFDSCLIKLFPTVRDIRRYINGLRLDLEIIGKEEVNPVDFLGIEAIRILAPNVYFAMAEEKDTFAFPAVEKIYGKHRVDPLPFPGMTDRSSTPDEKTRKEICERIIEDKSPEGLSGKIWKIVEELFPQMDSDPTPEFRQTWRKELRVCSGAVFDRYFCLSVPSASLSEKSLNDFLSTVGDVSASVEKLRKFEEEGKSGLVIERLFDHLDDLNDRQRENLLVSVLDFTESTTGRGPLFSGSESRESRATHLCYGILKRIPSQEKLELAARVIDSSQGVFSPAYLLESFYQHLQYAEEKELPEPPLFTKEDMRRLNGICIGKIEEAGKDGSLSDSKRLLYVLSYWKKRGTENAAKDYVAGLLKTKDGLFRFLTAFVYKEYFQTVGDPSVEITRKILKEEIVEFIDLGELDRLVDGLDPGSLTEEQADVIELYRNPAPPFSR